jgi:hypothetical protein
MNGMIDVLKNFDIQLSLATFPPRIPILQRCSSAFSLSSMIPNQTHTVLCAVGGI